MEDFSFPLFHYTLSKWYEIEGYCFAVSADSKERKAHVYQFVYYQFALISEKLKFCCLARYLNNNTELSINLLLQGNVVTG